MRYVFHPEIATVGQSNRAYLQRIVVIALSLFCVCCDFYLIGRDCRVFSILAPGVGLGNEASLYKNFSIAVQGIYEAFGVGGDYENPVIQSILDEDGFSWGDNEAIYFSGLGYAWVDYHEPTQPQPQPQPQTNFRNHHHHHHRTYDCKHWRDRDGPFADPLASMSKLERALVRGIQSLIYLTPCLGIAGIGCASVELCFVAFYPSVIAGAVFLASAAFTEIAWTILFVINVRQCFTENRCHAQSNALVYAVLIGMYLFSSMLLIFGLRTYPWCRRKNRNPKYCKDVDPEIISEEEMDDVWNASASASANAIDQSSNFDDDENTEFSDDEDVHVPWEAFAKMKAMLQQTNKELVRTNEELAGAVAEATRAEFQLRAYTTDRNNIAENDHDHANDISIAKSNANTMSKSNGNAVSIGDPLDRGFQMEAFAEELEIVNGELLRARDECRRAIIRAFEAESKLTALKMKESPFPNPAHM